MDTNGIITTVAGSGTAGFGGDGGAATSANLYSPSGVALDAIGNLFIADTSNNRIRKVDTNGNISTIAGTNAAGFSGDGGPAKVAKLNAPQGVAVDNFGNIFIADYYNNRIRRVDTNGTITTFAGSNFNGFGGDGGLAVSARLNNPMGVVVDSFGYVFFSDYHNNRIRQVDMNSIITTVAGNGSALFSGDGGAATNAGLFQPYGVTIETDGSLLITDMLDYCVRRAAMGRIPTLKFNGVTTNNAGNYQVIVSSPSGSVTSSVVSLTVGFGPSIVTQPQNTLAISGNPASFGLTASGNLPLGYQWYWNNNGLANGTNSSLNFPATTTGQAGNYFCVVTNSYGSITSTVVSMMVATPPSIVIQPTNQMILTGSNVTFGVVASGTGPLNYQWQLNGTNLPNNTIITTVAGIGIYATTNNGGYAGDGGPATNARLSSWDFPFGL